MIDPEKTLDQISDGLVEYLGSQLNDPTIGYEVRLTRLKGGYETYSYRFKLTGARHELSKPLVLRLYPSFYGAGKAVWESTVQNLLADQGYPVARAYWTCTDKSILGGAFFVMEFLPGEPMMTAPFETIPDMLGQAHAGLHSIDPGSLIRSLRERGFDERHYRLDGRMNWLQGSVERHPWLGEAVDWLMENRPPEPKRLSVCHGDFHPFNILVEDGQVTGVLDWPGFLVADPVLDVANTVVLTAVSAKHLLSLRAWERATEMYLDAYQAQRPLDLAYLGYYRARRCVTALAEGAGGQQVWRHPAIVQDLIQYTYETTGIRTTPQD